MPVFRRPRPGAPLASVPSTPLMCALLFCGALHPRMLNAAAVPNSLRACTQIADNDQRLRCFDQEMARAIARGDSSIGLTIKQQQQLDAAAARQNGAPPPAKVPEKLVSSTITHIVRRADGREVITLDNGQIWLQGEAYDSFNAQVGESVGIRSGLLGSFYMHAASGADTRVTRQR